MKRLRILGIAALTVFALCRTESALAYGPYEEFGRQDDVKAMVYVRLPLGPSVTEQDRNPLFGIALKREFLPAHPAYQAGLGPYVDPEGIGLQLLDLHFGMNGKGNGVDVAGWTMFGAESGAD
jgi:hypothetical protein